MTNVGRRACLLSPRRLGVIPEAVARPGRERRSLVAVPGADGVVLSGGRTCLNASKGMNMNIMSRTSRTSTAEDLREEDELGLAANMDEARAWRVAFKRWLLEDSPYIVMLLLAVAGVALRLRVGYWLTITPIYGIICVIAGWRHFDTAEGHRQLIYTQLVNWSALLIAVYILYNTGVQGVLNTSASALAMMTLLALGTVMAGLQARVWRICALGVLLFLAVPTIGWLAQSAMILFAVTVVVLALGALTWWLRQRQDGTV